MLERIQLAVQQETIRQRRETPAVLATLDDVYMATERLRFTFQRDYLGGAEDYKGNAAREYLLQLAGLAARGLEDLGLLAGCSLGRHTFPDAIGEPYDGQPCDCGKRVWMHGRPVVPLLRHHKRCTKCHGTGETKKECRCVAALGTNTIHSRNCPATCKQCWGRGHL